MDFRKNKRLFYLKTQLSLAVFFLIILLISGFFIFGPNLSNIAQALSGNYSKSVGDPLNTTIWNNLPSDFLARTGGATSAMQGDLDMGGKRITNLSAPTGNNDAVTKGAMDAAITGVSIKDTSNNVLKMVCGESSIGMWQYLFIPKQIVSLEIDTSAAGFTSDDVIYLTSLYGTTQHYFTQGATSAYLADRNSFWVHVTYNGPEPDFSTGPNGTWRWRLKWCGIGR